MPSIFIKDTEMRAIADAIREKNGTDNIYKPSEMPQAIKDIESGGRDDYYDILWDGAQQNGQRTNYDQWAHHGFFTADSFYPKYDIKPTGVYQMFANSGLNIDLEQRLQECGVVLDFSNVTSGMSAFQNSRFTVLPVLDCSSMSAPHQWFIGCTQLHTIRKIIVTRKTTAFNNTFTSCDALKEIRFEGEIVANISFAQSSELSMESVDSIINCLVKYEGTGTPPTLTLHKTVKGNLTDAQIAIITNEKNWTLA
jgi:hypothetical protein